MTPGEWLAWLLIASVVYNVLENWIDPRAISVSINNPIAGAIRLAFVAAILVQALVVLL